MTEIRTIPPQLTKDEWNSLLDHSLEKGVSYIIRKNGNYYEAINGSTGKIDYGGASNAGNVNGTNATAVIQNAINALTSGGTIFLKELTLPSVTYGNNILIIEDYQGERKVYSNQGKYRLDCVSTDPTTTGWGTAEKGRIWFNTSTNVFKYWNGSQIITLGTGNGTGDMSKSVYDTNDNGIVDDSEQLGGLTLVQVRDHPPQAHTLSSHSTKDHSELTNVLADQHNDTKVRSKVVDETNIADGKILVYRTASDKLVYEATTPLNASYVTINAESGLPSSIQHANITNDTQKHTPKLHKTSHVSGGVDAFTSSDLLESVVKRLRESSGPTDLTIGSVADGKFLKRSGTNIEGGAYKLISSYTIYTDGTTYYAMNADGSIVCSGNASVVIQSAADALTNGGQILLKNGVFSITSSITISHAGTTLKGESLNSILETSNTSLSILNIAADRVVVEDLYFRVQTGLTPVSGSCAVKIQPASSIYHVTVRNCYIDNIYDGIITGSVYNLSLNNLRIYNFKNDGIRIAGANDQYLENIVMDNGNNTVGYGIHLTKTGGIWMSDIDIIHCNKGILGDPSTNNTVSWVWMQNVAVDSCANSGVHFHEGNGGSIMGIHWTNGWSSGNGQHGIYLSGVDIAVISNLQIQDNQYHGILIDSGCYANRILGCSIQNNNGANGGYDGVHVVAGVGYFVIANNVIRINHNYSVEVESGTSDHYVIIGNLAVNGISDGGTGTSKVVTNNVTS